VELITMPQLGETVTEGTITRWYKAVGDPVAADEELFEVSTEKVDTDVPSAHAGFLRVIHVGEGETVPVGAPLAVITATADEPIEAEASGTPAAVADGGPAANGGSGGASEGAVQPGSRRGQSRPERRQAAPRRVGPASSASKAADLPAGDGFLSPAVQQLLDDYGLDASDVRGSGRDGRITRNDVLAAAANPPVAAAAAPPGPTVTAGTTARAAPVPQPGPDDDVIEFTKSRRATAEHMVRSLATSAHTLVGTEVDYFRLDPVRRSAGLSFLPFVARATVDALGAFPRLNASVGDDQLIVHRSVHLGFAVDVGFEALVVPVVRGAGDLRLHALSEAIAAQADKARAKQLNADDLTGGTFTITNVGTYGTVVTAPVINQPQVAILSTDGVRMRPTAVRDEAGEWLVAVHPLGNLSLSFDHRAVDGAYAAAFLARVRELLEDRDWAEEL
jgi:2-oxoglutarate dehydrogenase E2 component (dihydrolipoamide succinyltransferase)